jgi:glycerol-3-phosphate acyltransferase PlsY
MTASPAAWTIAAACAYGIGSIPFGVIIGHLRGVDIRGAGSGNIGATNVGRLLGKPLGILCFLLDMGKGAVPVLVSGGLFGVLGTNLLDATAAQLWPWLAVAIAALLGHMYSPFLAFSGGKGVATAFGGLAAMWPILTLPVIAAFVSWLVVLAAIRIISVASMVAAAVLPLSYVVWALTQGGGGVLLSSAAPPLIVTLAITLLVFWKHRENLGRLRRGEEPHIG